MSSILEALKKLEEEKAARRSVGNIAGKVTAPGRRARQRAAWMVPAAMAAVAAVAVLGTYAVMGGFSARHRGTAPVVTTAQPAPPPPLPRAAAPVEAGAPRPVLPASAPAPKVTAQIPSGAPRASTTPPAAKRAVPLPQPESPPESAAAPPAPSPGGEPPALNVSGIAWQKDNASRFAVVNGTPVSEGASVAGARVDEIFPDRVRFSYRGSSFEVSLGKIPQ